MIEARLSGCYREDRRYPAAIVNVTNHCNLACRHCFVFRDGNPNAAPARLRDEPADDELLAGLAALRDRHGIRSMLWMGGEPLLKPRLLERGVRLFRRNTITTNGTAPLLDLGPEVLYVVSLDGPEDLNDEVRGAGVYRRVMRNLARLPEGFSSPVQVQCVVTRRNQRRLGELVEAVRATRAGWMTFSFHVPRLGDTGPDAWPSVEARGPAVREVMRLRAEHPGFVRNTARSLELMLPPYARRVTAACPASDLVLPLYLEGDHLTTPFCCYGNDVECDRCGAWVVFHLAGKLWPTDADLPAG
jgi:MoaA/NifB/PqqE/SkfB family radical SAM enzyme